MGKDTEKPTVQQPTRSWVDIMAENEARKKPAQQVPKPELKPMQWINEAEPLKREQPVQQHQAKLPDKPKPVKWTDKTAPEEVHERLKAILEKAKTGSVPTGKGGAAR